MPETAPKLLDEKGRCCGRKPLVYKRPPRRFCHRCCRGYHFDQPHQIANWAWKEVPGGFEPTYPDHDYAR